MMRCLIPIEHAKKSVSIQTPDFSMISKEESEQNKNITVNPAVVKSDNWKLELREFPEGLSTGEKLKWIHPFVSNYVSLYKKIGIKERQLKNVINSRGTAIPLLMTFGCLILLAGALLSIEAGENIRQNVTGFIVGITMILIGLALIISAIIVSINRKGEEKYRNELLSLAEDAKILYEYIERSIPEFPKEYWYPMAVEYLIHMFETNRVDTLREALAMLDEQNHRWTMEALQKKNIQLQQQQAATLNAIWWQTFYNNIK